MDWMLPVGAAALASAGAVLGSLLVLAARRIHLAAREALIPFAVGTLLAAALLEIGPEVAAAYGPESIAPRMLVGILGFLAFERLLRWRHPAGEGDEVDDARIHALGRSAVVLVVAGDGLHNLVDGLVIGSAFTGGSDVGFSATLAIVAHEIPQEMGDFAILLAAGMGWKRALALNVLTQLPSLAGATAAFALGSSVAGVDEWLLPLAAGSFVYIALADLVPALQHERGAKTVVLQFGFIALGVAAIHWIA